MADSAGIVGLDNPRGMTPREYDIVFDVLKQFSQMTTWRNVFAGQYEEVSELIMPNYRNTFFYGNFNWPGQKKTHQQVDASGMMALKRFGAICDSLLTPRNMTWHGLRADNDYVMKDRASRLWFEQATRILFKYRYAPLANFASQNQANFQILGAFGTMGMFIDAFDPSESVHAERGVRYRSIPLGELFIRENHQGLVDGFIRWMRMAPRQILQKFGRENFPVVLRPALEQNSEMLYDVLHCVIPRTDYDPDRLDFRGMPFTSYYVSMEGKALLREGGYRMLPSAISRYDQAPQEVYGRGPAMDVLPALKTLNAEKRTFLKVGHRAADPVLLTSDDGLVGMSMRPGAVNPGGVSPDGHALVQPLPVGNIQISEKMMEMEQALINDAFLVSLFQILVESPQMTATEVIERTNEKGILLAPTIGRQQSEYLGPMIDRELDVLSAQGLLPPMPPRLREAQGEYSVVYTSPLARAAKAQEAAGFIRTVETVKELVNITGDPSLLDPFNFDKAVPAIADIQSVPPSWMASDQMISDKRKARAQQQQRQEAIQAAPARAAMMKAQAAAAKAGVAPAPAQSPAQGGPPLAEQVGQ